MDEASPERAEGKALLSAVPGFSHRKGRRKEEQRWRRRKETPGLRAADKTKGIVSRIRVYKYINNDN